MSELDQLIHTSKQVMTRVLYMELNINLNTLESMVATLGYDKACSTCVPWIITQEQKEHHMPVCQNLLKQYEDEGDSFLDQTITGDEMWFHHYGVKMAVHVAVNSPLKKKFKAQ